MYSFISLLLTLLRLIAIQCCWKWKYAPWVITSIHYCVRFMATGTIHVLYVRQIDIEANQNIQSIPSEEHYSLISVQKWKFDLGPKRIFWRDFRDSLSTNWIIINWFLGQNVTVGFWSVHFYLHLQSTYSVLGRLREIYYPQFTKLTADERFRKRVLHD